MFGRSKSKILKPLDATAAGELSVSLVGLDADLLQCFCEVFGLCGGVQVLNGSLTEVSCDAIVSPANSFGDMGGGLDKVIDDAYGGAAQDEIQRTIRQAHFGELPVGTAFLVTPAADRPAIVCAPTMRVPGDIRGTINPYLAMRAALICARRHGVAHLAVPGLGCGVGRIPYEEAAVQMRGAYDVIVGDGWRQVVSPAQAPFALRPPGA